MKHALRGFCFFLLLVLLAACSGQSPSLMPTSGPLTLPAPFTTMPLPTLQASVTPPASTATSAPSSMRNQYLLDATLDYEKKTLAVSEKIVYTNRSNQTLNELVLNVDANRTAGVFTLHSSAWQDGALIDGIQIEGVKMTLPLQESLAPGQRVKITLVYQLALPGQAGTLSFTSRQINLSGWYPDVVPYRDGKGWLIHTPGSVGEYQVSELADFDVNLQLEGAPVDLKLASSSPGSQNGQEYHFSATNVRNFIWSASTEYEILETSTVTTRIRVFVFPEHLEAGLACLQASQQAVKLYTSLYGSNERTSLTIVEATFADGMEYDGLYYLGQEYFAAYKSGADNYLTTLAAHETAHQWWYAAVANDQAMKPWLDEALCTYSERLFYENEHPDLLDWWINTRILTYEPQGAVNSSIYDFSAFRPYVNAVYLRGAEFLQALREQMGDANFMNFLHDYFGQLQQKASRDDLGLSSSDFFWQIVSLHYEGDLSDLQQTFFAEK